MKAIAGLGIETPISCVFTQSNKCNMRVWIWLSAKLFEYLHLGPSPKQAVSGSKASIELNTPIKKTGNKISNWTFGIEFQHYSALPW